MPKINLRKLVHLVDFIIRINHDARSPELQIIPDFLHRSTINQHKSHRHSNTWKCNTIN